MRQYRFQVSEYDAARPWIVVGAIQHHTVSLEDEVNFYNWSSQRWPAPATGSSCCRGVASPAARGWPASHADRDTRGAPCQVPVAGG